MAIVLTSAGFDSDPLASQTIGTVRYEQSPQTNPPGRLIKGRDGDTIVLEKDERVRVIHRRSANVRATFNPAERWLILVLDFAAEPGAAPDGRPDWTYTFRDMSGDWPLGERWEGEAIVEDYSVAGQGGPRGVGLRTSQGMVQLMSPPTDELFRDAAVVAVLSYRGAGRGGTANQSFDEAEQRAVADAKRNTERNAQTPGGTSTTMTSFGRGGVAISTLSTDSGIPPVKGGPVRVGGSVRKPEKIYDAPPVLPERARQAGVRGVVILELTIGADGAVTEARVLRSIPLLDEAAVAAVRQWRYDPTILNGQAVPVVITVPVNFQ